MTEMKIPQWGRFEIAFASANPYDNPFQDVDLKAIFVSPSEETIEVYGFWDGGSIWRIRFSPGEPGSWHYTTWCSDADNQSLHNQSGIFTCVEPDNTTLFRTHGPVQLSANRHYLTYADGTPYFWLADTAWNGPLWASSTEWTFYLAKRVQQRFTAIQWVATQWLAAPNGASDGIQAYTGHERIAVNPAFFQRLDNRHEQINQHGLLSAPVLLWTAGWTRNENDLLSPGFTLPEDQATRLARYMVARWQADAVLWILAGDGDYRGIRADRWKRIGRGVFADRTHAPVTLHPQGMQWNMDEFQHEDWLDIAGYQSSHYDNTAAYAWLVEGPPAVDWRRIPARPIINLEPNYENIGAVDTKRKFTDHDLRRALYHSLLIAPTAGVSYGAHGVWDWNDGTGPAVGHEVFGAPQPWQESLDFSAANQLVFLHQFFTSIDWCQLVPAPDMIVGQPFREDPRRQVVASRAVSGDGAVIYMPDASTLELDTRSLIPGLCMDWYNVRTGEMIPGALEIQRVINFKIAPPAEGDWLIWFHTSESKVSSFK